MCVTYRGLSKFTQAELAELNLAHGDLETISDETLLKFAQLKLERFTPKTQDQQKLKETFEQLLLGVGSGILYDTAKSVDWASILWSIVDFVVKNS